MTGLMAAELRDRYNRPLTWNQQLEKEILRNGFLFNCTPTKERHDCQIDVSENLSSCPSFRVVIIRGVPILLELDKRVRDSLQGADRGVIGIGELFATGFRACVVHLPMLKSAGESSTLTRLL